jgi:hypothetical protein
LYVFLLLRQTAHHYALNPVLSKIHGRSSPRHLPAIIKKTCLFTIIRLHIMTQAQREESSQAIDAITHAIIHGRWFAKTKAGYV